MTWKITLSILIFAIAVIGGKFAYDAFLSDSETELFQQTDWKQQNLVGISFEAPFELSESKVNLTPDLKSAILNMETYKYTSKPMALFISKAEYDRGIPVDLDGAVKGAINNIERNDGVSDFDYNVENIVKDSITGRRIEGKLNIKGEAAVIVAELFNKNSILIQIMCTSLDLTENRSVIDRIFNSIKLDL